MAILISPKLDKQIRIESAKEKLSYGDLVEKSYEAYLRQQEQEKNEKRFKKELLDKGQAKCPRCQQIVNSQENDK